MRFRKLKKQNKQKNEKVEPKALVAKTTDRIKAFITDMFMIYIPILYIITYIFMGGKDAFIASDIAPLAGVAIYGFIYSIFLSRTGQTPGKKAYDLKVVNLRDGKTLSFVSAYVRYLMFLFTSATLLGLLLPMYRKDKRALHDLICGSVVIVSK